MKQLLSSTIHMIFCGKKISTSVAEFLIFYGTSRHFETNFTPLVYQQADEAHQMFTSQIVTGNLLSSQNRASQCDGMYASAEHDKR